MALPIPTSFRWAQYIGRLTADRDRVHVELTRVEHLEIPGLPEDMTSLHYWALPIESRGILRQACDREREMTAEELASCRSYFEYAMTRMSAAARVIFGLDE